MGDGVVSEPVVRDYSFTVRLSAGERAELETLATQWGCDKSTTVRRALRVVLAQRQPLPQSGRFVALKPEALCLPVRLSGAVADGN
jgi:hypothetical protein